MTDTWYSYECIECGQRDRTTSGSGVVFDVRRSGDVRLPLPEVACPVCRTLCSVRRTWDADDGGYKIPQTAQRTIEVLAKDRDQWASRARVAESQVERSYAAGMTVREVELQQSLVGAYAREGDQRDKIVSLEAKFRSAQQRIRDLEEKLEKQ